MWYFFKPLRLHRFIFRKCIWKIPSERKVIYLTFDDGPTPDVTNYVLDLLKTYNAQATFFVLGSQVNKNPEILRRILFENHAVGNHTYKHPNGWTKSIVDYLTELEECDAILKIHDVFTDLFRPPYGRMTLRQLARIVITKRVIMWSILSGDFDEKVNLSQAIKTLKTAVSGDILVFHDSIKAFPQLKVLLPEILQYYSNQGFEFKKL